MIQHKYLNKTTMLILIITVILGYFSLYTTSYAVEKYDFSSFSEEDSLDFVEAHNIEIPAKLLQSDELAPLTLSIILQSYYSPNAPFFFNYDKTQQYAENINLAVKSYINTSSVPSIASSSSYALQYNTVMDNNGNWVTSGGYYDSKWQNYNCYAYSIQRAEQPQFYSSGDLIQYQPGNMSGQSSFDNCTSIEQLAEIIRSDLIAMNYSNISLSSTIPDIDSSQQLICVRMNDSDYHLMRYDIETDAWYHKPGNTAILKYNTIPSNDNLWYKEGSKYGVESYVGNPYDSNIIFITYSKNQINVSQSTSSQQYIKPNKDVFCELNFKNLCSFDIMLTSSYSFDYDIYNDDFDLILSGSGTTINTSINATDQRYFLRINFETNTLLHYVNVSITHSQLAPNYTLLSQSQHKGTCECGCTIIENHTFTYRSISDGFHSVSCSKCNYTYNEAHTMVKKNNIPVYCSKCHYVCDNSFYQPYGKPEDENEFL